VLYPTLPASEYPVVGLLVLAVAAIGAIYPGIRATKLSPVRVIRTH
jgi:ABC-type antimicrobial peptide transport system permease subunit